MDYELIFWIVTGIVVAGGFIIGMLPWNDQYNRNGDDPYRYCPKEDE